MPINRRQVLIGTAGAAAGLTIVPAFGQVPPLKKKDTYKVGFAQTESNNPWRLAQTASMKDEAAKRGCQLVYTDAAGSAAKQVADVNSMIAQGVDFIFLAPREEKPLATAVLNAKKAGIPVLAGRPQRRSVARQERARTISPSSARTSSRKASGSPTGRSRRPAARARSSNSKAPSAPRPPTTARRASTRRSRPRRPSMVILASQSGDFARDKGRQVAETLLQAHPDATIVYAHNDEMALGAIAAIEAAGKVPGKDILVVSIDGEKDARAGDRRRQAGLRPASATRASGRRRSTSCTTTPNGEKIPPMIINPDHFYDASNAKEMLATAF